MKYYIPLALLAGSTLFFACGPAKKTVKVQEIVMDTLTVSARNNPRDIYRAAAPRVWDITDTKVALSFDWKGKTARGAEYITLHPYCYDTDTLLLDAKSMKVDTVALVTANNKRALVFRHVNDTLFIRLDKHYEAADTIQLYLAYTAKPYADEEQGGSKAITDDRGLYFINTDEKIPGKPVQIWTQGESEANSHWMPTIDKPNERFTVQVSLTVPDENVTLSNGALISSKKTGSMRTDVWRIDQPIQPYAVMFAIGKFSIVKDQWQGRDVHYYVEPEYAPFARKIFNNTPEMMTFFSKATGVTYPWNKYDQVIVRDYVSGAMENTTASLFGEFVNQDAREIADKNYEDVVSHELFHQWFGDYVTAESWTNITVNESFANYGEYLWRKYKYGKASAEQLHYEDLNKYLQSARFSDPQLVRYYYADREDVFDRISYEKGGRILHYMHTLMGDAAFSKAMQLYLTKNALQPAEATNWRLAVEEATGQDWNWFFNQWYLRAGHPVLDVNYDYDDASGQLIVTVKQKQADSTKPYILPLKATLAYGNDRTTIDWNIRERKDVFSYPYRNGVKPVIIPDVQHVLPGELKETKTPGVCLQQYEAADADDYISRRKALAGVFRKFSDSASLVLVNKGFNDQMAGVRAYTLDLIDKVSDTKLQQQWRSQVAMMAMNDADNETRANAFALLGSWKVNSSKQDMITAVHDSSYMVAGAALTALGDLDKDTAYAMAKQLLSAKPRAELKRAIWTQIGNKAASEDIVLYEQEQHKVYGTRKFNIAQSLFQYLEKVKDEAAFRRGADVLTDLIVTESIKGYRMGLAAYLVQLTKFYEDKKDMVPRLELLKKKQQQMLDAETDEENKKSLSNMIKGAMG
jgi:aminopeptidase N